MITKIREKISSSPLWCKRLFSVAVLSLIFAISVTLVAFSNSVVTITDGDKTYSIRTSRDDVSYLLEKAGITVSADDEVIYSGISSGKGTLQINRAFNVQILTGDELITVKMTGGTVLDVLTKAGITYSADDAVNLDVNSAVSDGSQITYDSIDYQYVTENIIIEHDTTTEYSSTLDKGETKTVSEGVDGIKELTYRQKIVNGQVVESAVVNETVLQDVVHEKTIIGTKEPVKETVKEVKETQETAAAVETPKSESKPASNSGTVSPLTPDSPIELDANGRPVNYQKLITGKATAYSPRDGGYTATGKRAQVGYVAVDPDIIPYGTELYIITADGSIVYGYAVAEDTGGFTKSGKITVDLFFNTYEECISFGVRNVEIYVL